MTRPDIEFQLFRCLPCRNSASNISKWDVNCNWHAAACGMHAFNQKLRPGLWPWLQLVVEPSGAVGLAAALSPQLAGHPALAGCRRLGIVLCGGNVDFGETFWRQWLT